MLTNLLVGIYSKLKILIRFDHPCRGTEISQTSITNYSEISVAYVGCGCVHSHWLCLLELCFFCRYPLLPMRLCWFSPTATICNGLIPRWFQVWHILCVVKIYYLDNFWQAPKLNKEDAMDRCKWRKMIKEARWSGWVWVGECLFWYRPTRVCPGSKAVKRSLLLLLYLLPAGRSAANPPHAAAAVDQWDRQTGGRTDGRQTVSQTLLRYYAGCSSQRPAVRGTYVWYSEEVELEHADDGLSHGRPVGQVVSEPVTGMSTAARERRPTDNHTALTTTGRAAQRPTTTHSPSPLCPNRFFL